MCAAVLSVRPETAVFPVTLHCVSPRLSDGALPHPARSVCKIDVAETANAPLDMTAAVVEATPLARPPGECARREARCAQIPEKTVKFLRSRRGVLLSQAERRRSPRPLAGEGRGESFAGTLFRRIRHSHDRAIPIHHLRTASKERKFHGRTDGGGRSEEGCSRMKSVVFSAP